MPESFAVDQNICHPVDPTKERYLAAQLFPSVARSPSNTKMSPKSLKRIPSAQRSSSVTGVASVSPPSRVSNIDVSNIFQNMDLGVEGQDRMNLDATSGAVDGTGVGEDDPRNLDQMLDKAAAAAAGGLGQGNRLESTGSRARRGVHMGWALNKEHLPITFVAGMKTSSEMCCSVGEERH
ncbi:Mediator of RNA polymerase II transcription subunit 5 [Penicillium subrubescens]|uniref:Mediator of RNA polymerase II transcription subunit 5 n=2 Tax=Penicillium subrubescens TaxID=1316194 RepID=A0A1Q5UKB2_9EURO|nr:Mediator of RNA polymerase II transcription subunit 5 [Penicillium subrubescens]